MAFPQPAQGGRTPKGLVQEFTNHVHNLKSIIPHWQVAVAGDREEATVRVIRLRAVAGWHFHESDDPELLSSAFSRLVAAGFATDGEGHTCGTCLYIYRVMPRSPRKKA